MVEHAPEKRGVASSILALGTLRLASLAQDKSSAIGTSKGRGFAGVMKRHGFGGAPASHGHAEIFRGGGSIGMHTYPGRVLKGKKMPGRMGGESIRVQNLKVVRVDSENNVLLVRGAVPGANGRIVRIIKSERV